MYKLLFMLLGWGLFFSPGLASAQIAGKLTLYNSAYDYFRGDRLESVTYHQILEELKHYPPTYLLIGIGAVTQGDWQGAVVTSGTVGKSTFHHTVADKPHSFQSAKPESFPWLQLAVCNPKQRLERRLKGVRNIHQFIADQLQTASNISIAAIKIEGTLTNISYSPQPTVESPTYLRVDSPQEWEVSGLYFEDYALQLAASVPGKPLILFGSDSHKEKGGYIQAASAIEAEVFVYPLVKYQLKQSDLSIAGARLDKKLLVRVKNDGGLDVCQVGIKMIIPGTTTVENEVISLSAQEEALVWFNRPAKLNPGHILFQVDPRGLVWELREDNNILDFYFNQRR